MKKSILTIKNLRDRRIESTLSHPLSFDIKPGECVAVVGNNGVGKTTLLKIIAGLTTAEISEVETEDLFYCGHETGLKQALSVKDNLIFRKSVYQGSCGVNIEQALSYFELEKFLNKTVATLSVGQQKLVTLASAILCPYPLWVLDEPLANLDKEAQIKFTDLVKEEKMRGKAIVFTTHGEGVQMADVVVSL